MPTYEYECEKCFRVLEEFFKVADMPLEITCPLCGNTAKKIISSSTIFRDEPVWLNDNLRGMVQDESENPVTTRTELNKLLKRKGIVENPISKSSASKYRNRRKVGYMAKH